MEFESTKCTPNISSAAEDIWLILFCRYSLKTDEEDGILLEGLHR